MYTQWYAPIIEIVRPNIFDSSPFLRVTLTAHGGLDIIDFSFLMGFEPVNSR